MLVVTRSFQINFPVPCSQLSSRRAGCLQLLEVALAQVLPTVIPFPVFIFSCASPIAVLHSKSSSSTNTSQSLLYNAFPASARHHAAEAGYTRVCQVWAADLRVHAPLSILSHFGLANIGLTGSKFFGKRNIAAPKSQQSTLAFQKQRLSANGKAKDDEVETSRKAEESEESAGLKVEDADGDVKMNDKSEKEETAVDENEMKMENETTNGGTSSQPERTPKSTSKRSNRELKDDEDEDDEEPVRKRSRKTADPKKTKKATKSSPSETSEEPTVKAANSKSEKKRPASKQSSKSTQTKSEVTKVAESEELEESKRSKDASKASTKAPVKDDTKEDEEVPDDSASEVDDEEADSEEEDKPEVAAKARENVQSTLKSSGKDPYPDWKPGEPVPYAALCTTFSLIEMTTKRLIISAHCSLFLRQVMRLTPQDLLSTVQLMINKLAADYAGVELGIGESLIMKAIGESTGRSLLVIKADQNEIGDLGLVAAKSRSNQPTMFKPKPLTVKGVLDGLMGIATVSGDGSQGRKVAGIKKLLSAADAAHAGKGSKGIDITKDKGGASEAKFIVRFLEGKLRLGLAERTVLVALAHAMVSHETEKTDNKLPTSEKLAEGEAILKTVYR